MKSVLILFVLFSNERKKKSFTSNASTKIMTQLFSTYISDFTLNKGCLLHHRISRVTHPFSTSCRKTLRHWLTVKKLQV